MKNKISDFFFYKHRYAITYFVLAISYLAIIFYSLFVAPNRLTELEIESATDSANLNLSNILSAEIIDLPYKILQKISLLVFGLNNFSIKLPSIILSLAILLLLVKLTHLWFEKGVATMALIIAITSSQFFFLAQNGTPEILRIFYPILLILFGIKFIKTKKSQHLIFGAITAAFSLYSPLNFYILLAFGLTILAHPHLRFNINRQRRQLKIAGQIAFLLMFLPLAIAIYKDLSVAQKLLGIPNSFDFLHNLNLLATSLIGFSSVGNLGVISPIINFASLILISLGLYFTMSVRHTSRSYLIIILAVISLIVCLVQPHASALLFVPILILTITGLASLIQTWYTIFPQNPYARVAGLIPIVVFISSLLLVNLNNFRQNYLYSPTILANFSQDLKILNENLTPDAKILTNDGEQSFYKIFEKRSKIKVLTDYSEQKIIVTRAAFLSKQLPKNYRIDKILSSSRQNDSDRFYIVVRDENHRQKD